MRIGSEILTYKFRIVVQSRAFTWLKLKLGLISSDRLDERTIAAIESASFHYEWNFKRNWFIPLFVFSLRRWIEGENRSAGFETSVELHYYVWQLQRPIV